MGGEDAFNGLLFEKEAPVGMYRLSLRGKILKTNRALAAMLGYNTPDDLEGTCFKEKVIVSLSSRSDFTQLLHWNGRVEDFISPWRQREGSLLLVRETGWIIPDSEGGILFYEGAVNPVGECLK